MNKVTLQELAIVQEFDFVGNDRLYNSFFQRCRKTGRNHYCAIDGSLKGISIRIGTTRANVYHVGEAIAA